MRYRFLGILFSTLALASSAGCRNGASAVENEPRDLRPGSPLPATDLNRLNDAGWPERVGTSLGLWVSVARQQLVGVEDGAVKFVYACSTAERGIGSRENSYQTPLGWHLVDERIGDGLPKGAVFTSRKFTGEVWKPGDPTVKDLVLTRLLWLRGLEPGRNRGPGVDSHDRFIYIHGTPAEHKLGRPASMGCIRLSNDDVITVFDATPSGTRVLITEW